MKKTFSYLFLVVFIFGCTSLNSNQPRSVANAPASAIPDQAPVVIIGAGLTGLTAAYELKKQGIPSIILEASPRIGGRVQSVYFKSGNYAEGHMEEYFERSPAVALLRELGFRDQGANDVIDKDKVLAVDVAHSTVRINNKIIPYAGEGDRQEYLKGIFNEKEITALMKWNDKTWELYEKLHHAFFDEQSLPKPNAKFSAELQALQKKSFKDYVLSFGLPQKVSEWIRVTVEPEMAIEWDQISALDGIDEFRLFLGSNEKSGYKWGELNYHVVGGNTKFTDALANKLNDKQIFTNAMVTAVERRSDGTIKVRYLKDAKDYDEIITKAVVVTVPMYAIKNIQFIPALSAEKQKAIKTTKFGSYIKVHFTVDNANNRAAPLWSDSEGSSVLTLLSDSHAGSIYEATDFQRELPDKKPTNEVILTLLIHAHYAQDMYKANMNNDEMREYAKKSLDYLFPGVSQNIVSTEIFSYPTAVAYWPLKEGRSRFDTLSQELRRPEKGIYIGGDSTEDSHSEGAVRAGLRMAKDLIANKNRLLN